MSIAEPSTEGKVQSAEAAAPADETVCWAKTTLVVIGFAIDLMVVISGIGVQAGPVRWYAYEPRQTRPLSIAQEIANCLAPNFLALFGLLGSIWSQHEPNAFEKKCARRGVWKD
jgi:hypothetical protein